MDGLLASALCPELRIGGPIGIDCLRSRWVLTPGAFGPYCIHTTHSLGYVAPVEITPVVARQNPKPPICLRPSFLESISNRFRCHPPIWCMDIELQSQLVRRFTHFPVMLLLWGFHPRCFTTSGYDNERPSAVHLRDGLPEGVVHKYT